jgi:hypothetical protein
MWLLVLLLVSDGRKSGLHIRALLSFPDFLVAHKLAPRNGSEKKRLDFARICSLEGLRREEEMRGAWELIWVCVRAAKLSRKGEYWRNWSQEQ